MDKLVGIVALTAIACLSIYIMPEQSETIVVGAIGAIGGFVSGNAIKKGGV